MITMQSLAGWGVLTVFLVALADIPATERLGVAFAYVFLLAVLMAYGPAAFSRISSLVGSSGGSSSSLSSGGPTPTATTGSGAKPI